MLQKDDMTVKCQQAIEARENTLQDDGCLHSKFQLGSTPQRRSDVAVMDGENRRCTLANTSK